VVLDRSSGVVTVERVQSWDDDFREFFLGFSHWFSRADISWQAFKYLRGLLAPIERRNGWTIAQQAGDATPDAMQGLMCSPCFDRDAVRDEVRSAVVTALGDPGVLIADESGFVKKGVLCRHRHKRLYADLRIMPRTMLKALVNDGETSGLSA
jgi:SRSO17 transposase